MTIASFSVVPTFTGSGPFYWQCFLLIHVSAPIFNVYHEFTSNLQYHANIDFTVSCCELSPPLMQLDRLISIADDQLCEEPS